MNEEKVYRIQHFCNYRKALSWLATAVEIVTKQIYDYDEIWRISCFILHILHWQCLVGYVIPFELASGTQKSCCFLFQHLYVNICGFTFYLEKRSFIVQLVLGHNVNFIFYSFCFNFRNSRFRNGCFATANIAYFPVMMLFSFITLWKYSKWRVVLRTGGRLKYL